MKKPFIWKGAVRRMGIACCVSCLCMGFYACSGDYDDSGLRSDIEQLEERERMSTLEAWRKSVDSSVRALQRVIAALEANDRVVDATALEDGSGYELTFGDGGKVTIRTAGCTVDLTPIIGAKQDADGKYYWTANGEFLSDGDLKFPVTGEMLQIRINLDNDELEVSVDGNNWTSLKVEAPGDAIFAKNGVDTSDPSCVTFTLVDGTVIRLARAAALSIGFDSAEIFKVSAENNALALVLPECMKAEDYSALVAELKSEDGTTDLSIATRSAGEPTSPAIVIVKPAFVDGRCRGAAVRLYPPAAMDGRNAVLKVTLISAGGQEYTASRIVELHPVTVAEVFCKAIEQVENGGTVQLDADMIYNDQLEITGEKSFTFDLGGNTLSNTTDIWNDGENKWSNLSVRGAALTIKNGTIDAKENDGYCCDVRDGGTLIIESGTYTGNIHAIYVHDGSLEIKGGRFDLKQKNEGDNPYCFLINCLDKNYREGTAKISITGGIFVGFDPANNKAEGPDTNFVAEGYVSKKISEEGVIPEIYEVVAE